MPPDYGDQLRPRKRFGQHFLHDREVIARIVESVRVGPKETLVEIGPGRGALTTSLLAHCRALHLVELDRDLARILDECYDDESRVTVHQQDVLTFDFRTLAAQLTGGLVLVGNLPYNIASTLLIRLLTVVDCIDRAVFMLQREVAQRLAAAPGSRDYGRITVMIGRVCSVESLFNVDPTSFSPVPQVESTVIRLTPRPYPIGPVVDEQAFSELVRTAFSQRRKTLRNALKHYQPETAFSICGIDPEFRPEMLSAEDFAHLTAALSDSSAECRTRSLEDVR